MKVTARECGVRYRCLLVVLVTLSIPGTFCLDNGLALTPPMGWMTWERFRCTVDCQTQPENCINEQLIKEHADILSQPEWSSLGYKYVNLDDCWMNGERDSGGHLVGNSSRFPNGMAALAAYVHSKGLRLGTYNDMGTKTCGGYPGECGDENCTFNKSFIVEDAKTYASWGIDSLKMDGCNSIHTHAILDPAYIHMGDALNKTKRPILYSCSWPDYIRTEPAKVNYSMTAQHCNIWRMYNDIQDSWTSVTGIVDWVGDNALANGMLEAAGPGHFNDPDMLIIGNFGLSYEQSKAQMALWCIMAAPLLMGNDLRNLAPELKAILTAAEVVAVDQDPLGKQGQRVAQSKGFCDAHDVWAKPLAGGDLAVVLWNRGVCGTPRRLTVQWTDLKLDPAQPMRVRDLFLRKDLGTHTANFTSFVNVDGVVMLRLVKSAATDSGADNL